MLRLSNSLCSLVVLLGLAVASAQTPERPVVRDLQVELSTTVKAKKAKAGDAISAITIVPITLVKGVVVPAGAKVLGHVRQVEADFGEGHTSYIALSFEEVVVKKGETVPLNCIIRAAMMPTLKGVTAQGTESGQSITPMPSTASDGMSRGAMGGMGMGSTGMGGPGSSNSSGGVVLPGTPQPQDPPKPIQAHNGEVIGMRGVELQINGPNHWSTFRSARKNLELDGGLQLMLVVQL